MPDELRALTTELHRTNEGLRDVLDRLDTIEGRSDVEWKRAWWHRLVSALLIAIVLAMSLWWRQDTIRNCEASNGHRADTRHAITETVVAIVERSDNPDQLTPVVERIQTRLADTIPDRDCSTGVWL